MTLAKKKPSPARKKSVDLFDLAMKYNNLGWQEQEKKCTALRASLRKKGYRLLGKGVTRETYGKPGDPWVIKLPLGSAYPNIGEVKFAAKTRKSGIKVAKCSLEIISGVPCVKMERVKTLITPQTIGTEKGNTLQKKYSKSYPWISAVDCCQIGKTSDGRIVAFDVGNYS